MDINDNQQINTFTKGMNTDTSDMLLSTEQYRYAENVRLVTNTNSDTGELRIIDGNVVLTNFGNNKKLLYINSIQNYVVAIVETEFKNSSKDPAVKLQNPEWEIQLSKNCGETWKTIFGPCKELLHEKDKQANISGVLRWETDKDVKFYFVDDTGKHGIMYLNIAEDVPVNEKYMTKIEGIIDYQSQYLCQPEAVIGDKIGDLIPARVQYTYRLYKEGKASTHLSPFSKLLSLYKDGISGYNQEEISSNSVDIVIKNIKTELHDRIQLYRITYNQNGNIPIINLIYDGKVYESTFAYTDLGTNKYQISSEEFLALNGLRIHPKVIESKENYLYAANITDDQDLIDETFKDVDTISWTSGMKYLDNPYYHDQYKSFESGDMNYHEEYWKKKDGETIGGDGEVIDWRLEQKSIILTPNEEYSIQDQVSSFKHGEIYRFGIIFYDNKGRKTSPKWIADIMIPNHKATDVTITSGITASNSASAKSINPEHVRINYRYYNISFTVRTNKLPECCTAYEIVRCNRTINDRISLTQGIVGRPMKEYKNDAPTTYLYNTGYFTNYDTILDKILCASAKDSRFDGYFYRSARDVVMFASPESTYCSEDTLNVLSKYKNKLSIRNAVSYLIDTRYYTDGDIQFARLPKPFESNDMVYTYQYAYTRTSNTYHIHHGSGSYNPIPDKYRASFLYMCPFVSISGINTNGYSNITDIKHAQSPKWDSFVENEQTRYRNDVTTIGSDYQFINWTTFFPNVLPEEYSLFQDTKNNFALLQPIAAGGDLFLFKFQDDVSLYEIESARPSVHSDYKQPLIVVDVIKHTIPYGGYSKHSINSSTFYSYGDVCELDGSSVKTINISSGDSYPGLFTYVSSHQWYAPEIWDILCTASGITMVPVESSIDLRAQCGHIYDPTKLNSWLIQNDPSNVFVFRNKTTYQYIQDKPAYTYNTAYGCQPTLVALGINEEKDIYSPNFNTRIHYSEPKTNGEDIDNWLAYKPINYIDVDSRYGDITELRLFKEHLMFWQPDSTGIISSNERSVVQDTSGTDLILGSGAVAQRYDYISTKYGMKYGQFNDTQSNTSLYWWDGNEKEILQYTSGSQVIPLSTTKSIKNYINENKEVDRPNLFYNNKYKELVSYIVNKESVVYNEQVDAFTSIYKFEPKFNTSLVDYELISDGNKLELMDKNNDKKDVKLFNNPVYPLIQYVVNKNSTFVKTFDIQTFGGRFYGGDEFKDIKFEYNTPLKQHSSANGEDIVTTREYDFRLNIPRAEDENGNSAAYGDRMRGKTMQCEMSSISNSKDFSLQYITTKYRISWS